MDYFDPFHPYNDDNGDDDIFMSMMCRYSTDMILPEPAPLLTRCAVSNRDRVEEHRHLVHDYLVNNCVYQPSNFKIRFRLRKNVFQRIANALENRYRKYIF